MRCQFFEECPAPLYDPLYTAMEPVEDESEVTGKIDRERAVLVVEDDSSLRIYLKKVLTTKGFSFIPARTADEAVKRVKEYRPKVIILDYALPWDRGAKFRSGGDVLNFLFGEPETKNTGIILITCHDPEIFKKEAYL